MHFAGSNPATDAKTAPMASPRCQKHLQNFEKLQSQKIAPIRFDELGQEKSLEISVFLVFSCLHLNQTLIMCRVSDLDAKPCVADLDAH